ncbi:MAG: hypothetical protein KJ576_21000 [Proteobacteria bacterium]|nr:hypothetical protein [Pseudomonadota bacterium]
MEIKQDILFFIESEFGDEGSDPIAIWATDGGVLEILYRPGPYGDRLDEWQEIFWPGGGPLVLPPALKLDLAGMRHLSQGVGYYYAGSAVFQTKDETGVLGFTTWAQEHLDELEARCKAAWVKGSTVI